jgi:GNAT superfamily N-acetyltransferase
MRIIRPAMPTDIRVLAEMLAALIREHETQYPDAYPKLNPEDAAAHYAAEWHRRLQDDPACHVWLATDRDVRGFLAGEVWSRAVGEPPAAFFVEWLYVTPEHRKSGLARALWREGLIPYCRRHGIGVVEGRTVPGDTQWTARGWATTALSIMRNVDALAVDVAEPAS